MFEMLPFDIPTIVFSRLVSNFSKTIMDKYKMSRLNFSSVEMKETPPRFPFVTLIEIPGMERDRDNEGNTINAMQFGFQADVFSNNSKEDVTFVTKEVMRIMKQFRFSVIGSPNYDIQPNKYRCTTRYRRTIGNLDQI